MIDKDLIKNLRNKRSWSQDQLASVSGLSLRTVQRIEKAGACSLDSKMALAAAFDIHPGSLEVNASAVEALASQERGRKYGLAGAGAGLVSAYIGITVSFTSGGMTSGEAGIYYASTAAFCGLCCAVIGVLSNRYHQSSV
ncbi:MAG: helix-turn-helix domain-containing protein [Gammaproteobacteria bacterium]|nr:helix-turn-helix domain-containing protein [Gammaproteobacteria bacterium]